MNEIQFLIGAYDYSVYHRFNRFFSLLDRLNIRWYFHLSNRDNYLILHIDKINRDKFELIKNTDKYNL